MKLKKIFLSLFSLLIILSVFFCSCDNQTETDSEIVTDSETETETETETDAETEIETDSSLETESFNPVTWRDLLEHSLPTIDGSEDPKWEEKILATDSGHTNVYEGKVYENGKYAIWVNLNYKDLSKTITELCQQRYLLDGNQMTENECFSLYIKAANQKLVSYYVKDSEDVILCSKKTPYIAIYADASEIEALAKCPLVSSIISGDSLFLDKELHSKG